MAVQKYTPEELKKHRASDKWMTPERIEAIRLDSMGPGWSPEYTDSLDNVASATARLVGDDKTITPEKIAQYTPKLSGYMQQQQALNAQSNAGRMSAMIELHEAREMESKRRVSMENVAHMQRLSQNYGVTMAEFEADEELRAIYDRLDRAGLTGKHMDRALTMARANSIDGSSIALSTALKDVAHWTLLRNELDVLLGLEVSNRGLSMQFISSGWRVTDAQKAYYDVYAKDYALGGGNPDELVRHKAEIDAATVEAAGLPEFNWDWGDLGSYPSGMWYKALGQAGLWSEMGLPVLVGRGAGLLAGSLPGGQAIAPWLAVAGEVAGLTSGARVMAGSMLYEMNQLPLSDSKGNYVELDADIKILTATMSGVLEAIIERQQLGGVVAPKMYAQAMKSPLFARAYGALANSILGSGGAEAVSRMLLFSAEEMFEEGAQGVARQVLINSAIAVQKQLRGTDIDWNYAGVGDYLGTFREEAMGSFQTLFLMGVPGAFSAGVARAHGVANLQKYNAVHAKVGFEQYNNIEKAADGMKATKLSPEMIRDAVTRMQERDGDRTTDGTMYVPYKAVEEAFATIPNEVERTELLNRMRVDTDSVIESSISGSDVVMKMADIAVILGEYPDVREAIKNAMMVDPVARISHSQVPAELARIEKGSKELTRAVQAIMHNAEPLTIENSMYVASEVIAPIIQTEEGLNKVSKEFGIEPIVLQRMVFEDNADVPINKNRITDYTIPDDTFSSIVGGIKTTEGNETIEQLAAKRIGVRPDSEIIDRAAAAITAEQAMYGRLLNAIPEIEARNTASIMGHYFERQSMRVGMTAEQYRASYGDIQFIQDKGRLYMVPSIVEEGSTGAIKYGDKILISLTPKDNVATVIHELMHFMLFDMERLAAVISNADQQAELLSDLQTLKEFAGWGGDQKAWTVPQLEKVADAFVKYIIEGKAPAKGLKGAFRQLKKMIGNFYSHWFQKGELLSDEVKNVFGNMLSIEMEAEQLMDKLGITYSKEGLSIAKEVVSVGELHLSEEAELAKEKAHADVVNKFMDDMQVDIRGTTLYKNTYAKALEATKQQRVYQYLELAKTDKEVRLSRSEVQELMTEAEVDSIPEYVLSDKGGNIDGIAFMADYNSASEMLNEIIRAEKIEDEADAKAIVAIQGTGGIGLSTSDQMEALMGGTAKTFHAHIKQLEPVWKAMGMTPKRVEAEVKYLTMALQSAADERILNMKHNLLPAKKEAFIAARARAQQEYRDAMKAGNYNLAQRAATKAALNDALLRATKATLKNVARDAKEVVRGNKIVAGPKNKYRMDDAYAGVIEDILINTGFREEKIVPVGSSGGTRVVTRVPLNEAGQRHMTIQNYIDQLYELGIEAPIAPWLLTKRRIEGAFTANEYRDIADAISFVIKDGRKAREDTNANVKDSLASRVNEITGEMDVTWAKDESKKKGQRDARLFGLIRAIDHEGRVTGSSLPIELLYNLPRLESFTNVVDGKNNRRGAMWKYIYKPGSDARDREMLLSSQYGEKMAEMMQIIIPDAAGEKRFRSKQEVFHQIFDLKATQQQRLMLVALMGEKEGRERARYMIKYMTGVADVSMITDAHLNILANTLTTAEAEWVNKVHALGEELGQLLNAENYKETGRYMRWITKIPQKIVPIDSTDGTPVVLTGGYVPLLYDKDSAYSTAFRDRDVAPASVGAELFQSNSGQVRFNKKTTIPGMSQPGYMKERVSNVNYPVRLEVAAVAVHTQEVLHNITHRAAVKEMIATINSREVKNHIIDAFGPEMWQTMNKLVTNLAGTGTDPVTTIGKALRNLRVNAGAGLIVANVSSALNQTLSLATTAADVGPDVYKQALAIFANPDMRGIAKSESAQIANRYRGTIPTAAEYIRESTPLRGRKKGLIGMGPYGIMIATDSWVSTAIYFAAKNKGFSMGLGEKGAIEYAESILRRNQDMSSLIDQSLLQQSGEVGKLITMFWSANGAMFGRMWETSQWLRQSNISRGEAWGAFLWENTKLLSMLTLQSGLIRGTLPWMGSDDDDDKDKNAWHYTVSFFREMGSTALGTIPLASGMNARGQIDLAGLKGLYGIRDMFGTIGNMAEDFYDEGVMYMLENNGWDLMRDTAQATLALPVAFPTVQFQRVVRAIRGVMEEDDTIGRAVTDGLYYNQYTDRLRKNQGLFW